MTTSNNFSQISAFIWSVADLLRGDFKQPQYGRIILPFTLLRRLECLLAPSKDAVLAELDHMKASNLPEGLQEELLIEATNGLTFFNTSPMDLGKMGQGDIEDNLERYIQCFSADAREIFEHFKFDEFIGLLDDANLLFKVVKKFATTDLSPQAILNHDMGLVFEELVRRFAESSNETAGEHFTPRDIVRLTTSLVFMEDDGALTKEGIIRTIYDPTAGTGGFLSSGMEYVHELNPNAVMRAFGQELNPESYAICKADMLIKGQDVSHIKLGNTLSNDQLAVEKFDYMLSNPPFGVDWKKIEGDIKDEHTLKGFDGRFGAGLPRVSDGSLLFLMHLISKMRDASDNGGRIGIILNGSPLFTGGAGSGESEIRRYILESDLLEAIIALPTDMFYNTGIAAYLWILSNKKKAKRKGKVQLIDGSSLFSKMRKSLGSKRNIMSEDDIKLITRSFSNFEQLKTTALKELGFTKPTEAKSSRGRQAANPKADVSKKLASKVLNTYEFGYRRITIERPLRLSAQVTDEAIASLRFAPKPYNAAMMALYEKFSAQWATDNLDDSQYGDLSAVEIEARAIIKANFPELKEKQIKDVLEPKLWLFQKSLMKKAQQLLAQLGNNAGGKQHQSDDFNQFKVIYTQAFKVLNIQLNNKEQKQFIEAVTWRNQNAEPVIENVSKEKAVPMYGLFEYKGRVVEFKADYNLRDHEDVPLDSKLSSSRLVEKYFLDHIQPHSGEAWVKANIKDDDLGIIGYKINFRSFFQKNHSRDKSLQGNTVRLKEVVQPCDDGMYVLDNYTGKVTEFSGLTEQRKQVKPIRFDFYQELLLPDFYNIFIQLDEGKDWLDGNFAAYASTIKNVNLSAWLNARITIPPIVNQSKLIDFWNECESVLTRVSLLKNSLLSDFQSAQEQLSPYKSVANRYEKEFSSILPTPLAILWELAESKFNDRERSEAYIKFFEYLGLYLVSIVFGSKKPPKKRLYCPNRGFKRLTMAFGHNRLNEYIDDENLDNGVVSLVCSRRIIELLSEANDIRNDIAHRGLPSAAAIKDVKENVQRLIKSMQFELREFFETTTLITPIQAKFDGEGFLNEVEVQKGLGLNPSKTAQLKTSEPMVSGRLYLAHNDLIVTEKVTVTEIFPLMVMHETLCDSEIFGFYFYSDEYDNKLRFVCPYPNVETYKLFDKKLLKDNLND
jgi:type I restriction-modification system DNA methylase subunit